MRRVEPRPLDDLVEDRAQRPPRAPRAGRACARRPAAALRGLAKGSRPSASRSTLSASRSRPVDDDLARGA